MCVSSNNGAIRKVSQWFSKQVFWIFLLEILRNFLQETTELLMTLIWSLFDLAKVKKNILNYSFCKISAISPRCGVFQMRMLEKYLKCNYHISLRLYYLTMFSWSLKLFKFEVFIVKNYRRFIDLTGFWRLRERGSELVKFSKNS